MSNLKDLTVIIVTFKTNEEILFNCLDSIKEEVKVLLVENSSNQEFKNKIENKYNNVHVILSGKNLGYGGGNNLGLKNTKIYQASTSEMFGKNYTELPDAYDGRTIEIKYQDEQTPFQPQSPYAIAKMAAHHLVSVYREAYNIFGCCGILFNHESERRGENFVTRKITKWIAEFSVWVDRHNISYDDLVFDSDEIYIPGRTSKGQGYQFPKLRLGNLDTLRDWGHAKDYVEAMYLMMQQGYPSDYVIATGKTHSIRDLLDTAFSHISIYDWNKYIVIDPRFYRPAEVEYLLGLSQKAENMLGWKPKITFEELIKLMVDHDINATQKLE